MLVIFRLNKTTGSSATFVLGREIAFDKLTFKGWSADFPAASATPNANDKAPATGPVLFYMDMNLLDGYTENVEEQKDDIIPILKEMIDLGEIDTSMLTPHLRLMIVMSSIGVKTMEKNNDKKKSAIPMRDLELGGVGEEGQ